MVYRNDDNGAALRRLEARGDDLVSARTINFSVVFRHELSAEEFAAHFRRAGYDASLEHAQVKETHPWDVCVVKHMIPSHSGITNFEEELQGVADTVGGHNDGWGFFTQNALSG